MSNATKIKNRLGAISAVSLRVLRAWALFLCGAFIPPVAGCNPEGGGEGGGNKPCANPGPAISLGVVDGTQGRVSLPFRAAGGKYCVQVKSGPAGYDRASAATVAINGEEFARERDFNQSVEGVFSELDLAGENNTLEVHVKSGPKSKKGCSNCEKVHAVEVLLAAAVVPGAEGTSLHVITPSGGDFETEGWSYHFEPGAVAQPTVLSVSCEPVIAGIGPSCEIQPHTEFSFGSVILTMPIEEGGLPEQTKPSDIFAFRNGQEVPSHADLSTKTLTAFPRSFSTWIPTVKLWKGEADPPIDEIEPKTVPTSTADGSYSDEYGIGIGLTSAAVIQVVPGYIDPNDHTKGFKEGWQTTGKVSLCRKLPGQSAYTEVATGDYVKGHQRVLFGPGVIAMGKNYFFAVFQEGNTAPGCATNYPSPPQYRSADLTFTRLDPDYQEPGSCTCVNSASTVTYWRHDVILDMIHEQMTTNEISEEVFMIRGWLESNLGVPTVPANVAWFALVNENHMWDHKKYIKNVEAVGTYPYLDLDNRLDQTCWKYFYPFPDQEFELGHDFWSNLHYGYVGSAAGFDIDWLLAGGAAFSGNDEIDDTATLMGHSLWWQHGQAKGGTLTKQHIEEIIALNFTNLVAIVNSDDYEQTQIDNDKTWGVDGGVCPESEFEDIASEPWIFRQIIPLDDGK